MSWRLIYCPSVLEVVRNIPERNRTCRDDSQLSDSSKEVRIRNCPAATMSTSYGLNRSLRVCYAYKYIHEHYINSFATNPNIGLTPDTPWGSGFAVSCKKLKILKVDEVAQHFHQYFFTIEEFSLVPRLPHPPLQYEKRGEGMDGFITWCVPLLMSRIVASHDRSSSNWTHRTNWTERMNWIQGKKSEGERTNPDVSRLNVTSAVARITW